MWVCRIRYGTNHPSIVLSVRDFDIADDSCSNMLVDCRDVGIVNCLWYEEDVVKMKLQQRRVVRNR